MAVVETWTCFDCDWDNDVSLSVCEMCDTARDLSCVSRADREDASIVKARQQELAELQQRREAEIRATRAQQEEEQRRRQEEQQRQQEERQRHLRAQRAAEERRQKEADLWASTRMAQLRQELRGLRGLSTSARKAHIRGLQLELHPDKQPEERRQEAKRLFLLVQSEWETLQSSSEMPWEGPSPGRAQKAQADWAQRRAQTFDEARKAAKPEARAPPKPPPDRKDPPRPKTSEERKPSEFRFADLPEDSASEDEGDCLELGVHWCAQDEDDEGTGIVPLLTSGLRCFPDVMQAFTSIQIGRKSRGLDAERPGHPWRGKMDRFEAEAWRLYAQHQSQKGFHTFAIAEHLHKALRLDPNRGELYLDRATYRARHACAELLQNQVPADPHRKELQQVLEDCKEAIARDSSLLEAFHLAIRICCVRLELSEAKRLAARGHRAAVAAGDSVRASHFSALRRCAHVVHYGLERAQNALLAKKPEELLGLVEAMDAVVEPELEAVLAKRLATLRQQASTQRQFQEAYASMETPSDEWASAWGF